MKTHSIMKTLLLCTSISFAEQGLPETPESRCIKPEKIMKRDLTKIKTDAQKAEYNEVTETYNMEQDLYKECLWSEMQEKIVEFDKTEDETTRHAIKEQMDDTADKIVSSTNGKMPEMPIL